MILTFRKLADKYTTLQCVGFTEIPKGTLQQMTVAMDQAWWLTHRHASRASEHKSRIQELERARKQRRGQYET
jgi:hypothetical protein